MASAVPGEKINHEVDWQAFMKEIFSPGYKFPLQDTDESLKVHISDSASFGDVKDASLSKSQNDVVHGTIIGFINTVRKFHPGNYKVTFISLFDIDKSYDENDPLVIFHHEQINPNLLALQVIRLSKDYEEFHQGMENSINRYDWFHWTHFEQFKEDMSNEEDVSNEDDSEFSVKSPVIDLVLSILKKDPPKDVKSTVPLPNLNTGFFKTLMFFTNTEKASQLESCIFKKQICQSSTIKDLFSVQDDNGDTISLGVHFTPFNSGEWEYAKAFQDSDTGSYFALVLNGYLTLANSPWSELLTENEKRALGFTSLTKTKCRFPMAQFMMAEN